MKDKHKLSIKLMTEYYDETHCSPQHGRDRAVTLQYISWLERRAATTEIGCNSCKKYGKGYHACVGCRREEDYDKPDLYEPETKKEG